MAGIFSVISKLFGNKYEKDIKKIKPTLDLIPAEPQRISSLSNDEVRELIKLKEIPSNIHDDNISGDGKIEAQIDFADSDDGDEGDDGHETVFEGTGGGLNGAADISNSLKDL